MAAPGAIGWSQEWGRAYCVGFLTGAVRNAPRIVTLFDELRTFDFNEVRICRFWPKATTQADQPSPVSYLQEIIKC